MLEKPNRQPFYTARPYRIISAVLGLLIAAVGLYALLLTSNSTWLQWLVAVLIILLGSNMLLSALAGRESWLSKLGPLP